MRFGKSFLAAVAATSLLSAPVMAQSLSQTAKAAATSEAKRAGASVKGENKMDGESNSWLLPVAFFAVMIGSILVFGGDDNDRPTSP